VLTRKAIKAEMKARATATPYEQRHRDGSAPIRGGGGIPSPTCRQERDSWRRRRVRSAESALFILSLAKPLDQVDEGLEEVRPFGLDM
jgi:hypothetical protein